MNYNEYECPECGEWVRVELPAPAQVKCSNQKCALLLNVDVDAEFDEGGWHDRTSLAVANQNDSRANLDAAQPVPRYMPQITHEEMMDAIINDCEDRH